MHTLFKFLIIFGLTTSTVISDSSVTLANTRTSTDTSHDGYSALKIFLEDEQYLTVLRRTKMIVTFSGISEKSTSLIDEIADTADLALDELEQLAVNKPAITFVDFEEDSIAKSTLDSLRMAAVKELLFESEEFEKNLLLSQLKILRVISHLALQLEEKETDLKRKAWLKKLSEKYENFYQQVNTRISIS